MSVAIVVSTPTPIEPLPRHEVVLQRIQEIKNDLVDRSLELGRLLIEARDGSYHEKWGFARFGDWVEEASGLDMGERQAYYLMQIVERSAAIGITDGQLRRVKLSKLKEIFALKEAEPELIKELVSKAETATLEQIKQDVQMVKVANGGEPFLYVSYRIPLSVKELGQRAFEHLRQLYGTRPNEQGENIDIPDWKCLELCFAAGLTEQGDAPAPPSGEVIDAEFQDIAEFYQEGQVEG
jgi:hypothetical protein